MFVQTLKMIELLKLQLGREVYLQAKNMSACRLAGMRLIFLLHWMSRCFFLWIFCLQVKRTWCTRKTVVCQKNEHWGEPHSSYCLLSKINNKDPWNDGWWPKVYISHYEVWADVLGMTRQVILQCIYDGLWSQFQGFNSVLTYIWYTADEKQNEVLQWPS